MAFQYEIDFTDPLRPSFMLDAMAYDGPGGQQSNSTLRLHGRGAKNWGEAVNEDLVRLLENFASATPPLNPNPGQIWCKQELYWRNTTVSVATPGPADPNAFWRWNFGTDAWETSASFEVEIVATLPSSGTVAGEYNYNQADGILYRWDRPYKQAPLQWMPREFTAAAANPGVAVPNTSILVRTVDDQWITIKDLSASTEFSATGMVVSSAPVVYDGSQAQIQLDLNLNNPQDGKTYGAKDGAFVEVPELTGGVIPATAVPISADSGNLIQQRTDGIYYGTVAPVDVAQMYVDYTSGDDSNPGTELLPVKTIAEALSRGPSGVNRTLYLREQQNHPISAASTAYFRGGSWDVAPYGPISSALPNVYGNSKFSTLTALTNVNCNIVADQYAVVGDPFPVGSGEFQVATALAPIDGAIIAMYGITLVAGYPIPASPVPLASSGSGTFISDYNEGSWVLLNCVISLPHADSKFFSQAPRSRQSLTFYTLIDITGSGKLTIDPNTNIAINNQANDHLGANAGPLVASYISNYAKATDTIYNLTTNLSPALFP